MQGSRYFQEHWDGARKENVNMQEYGKLKTDFKYAQLAIAEAVEKDWLTNEDTKHWKGERRESSENSYFCNN